MAVTRSSNRLLSFLSFSTPAQMMWALVVGIVCGLVFGEQVAWMQMLGDGMILLMQMTVFPYILVSLIAGIGKLDKASAQLLFREAGFILLSLWVLGLVCVFALMWILPPFESASFFNPSSVQTPTPIDYFKLYIPSNPFSSMAEGAVPAMVIFSLAVGFALMTLPERQQMLGFLTVATQALSKVTQALVKILPIGIFCMSAAAAGPMSVEEFASMQVYLMLVVLLCVLLSFWVLPWLIACLCPTSFKEVLQISRSALVTVFATGNVLIVLPVIVEECKQLLAQRGELENDDLNIIDILVPIAFSFPSIGKISVMIFIVFAAWFSGKPLELSAIPGIAIGGLFALFGSVYVAIPFMLNLAELAQELFQLFVMSGFITGRFTSVMTVMHLFAFTLLAASAYKRLLQYSFVSLFKLAAGLIIVFAVVLWAGRWGLQSLKLETDTSDVIANMTVAEKAPKHVERQVLDWRNVAEQPLADIHAIKARGVLKVGYRPSYVPFSYYNNKAQLVGFDIAMMQGLAEDLGVELEFVAYAHRDAHHALNKGLFDIAVSAIAVNIENMQTLSFTTAVLELAPALAMKDFRIDELNSIEKLKQAEHLKVAYVEHLTDMTTAQGYFPDIEFVAIDHYKRFYKDKTDKYDALLISAEAGAAWSLFFPQFDAVIYDRERRYPASYAVAWDNDSLLRFLNNWLALQKINGAQQRRYQYWILGQGAKNKSRRWSIKEDVLHL